MRSKFATLNVNLISTECPRSVGPFCIVTIDVPVTYYYMSCPRSSNPFYIVTYFKKWVTTSWTHSTSNSYYYISKK